MPGSISATPPTGINCRPWKTNSPSVSSMSGTISTRYWPCSAGAPFAWTRLTSSGVRPKVTLGMIPQKVNGIGRPALLDPNVRPSATGIVVAAELAAHAGESAPPRKAQDKLGQGHQQGSPRPVHGVPGATTSGGGTTNTERPFWRETVSVNGLCKSEKKLKERSPSMHL